MDNDRTSLIDRLCELDEKGIIKYHFISSIGIEYCDERLSPILLVSQHDIDLKNNKVSWLFEFLDTGENYIFSEPLNHEEEKEVA